MKAIKIHINPFAMTQNIYIFDYDTKQFQDYEIKTKQLVDFVIGKSHDLDISTVILTGSKIYNTKIKSSILIKENQMYSTNLIDVILQ